MLRRQDIKYDKYVYTSCINKPNYMRKIKNGLEGKFSFKML